jgi:DNA-binding transcriptional ArsR family regulator
MSKPSFVPTVAISSPWAPAVPSHTATAPLVGISEAGLSKHLRQLADAGIVQSRREGYYVLYSLVPDRIDALSDAVRQFVKGE